MTLIATRSASRFALLLVMALLCVLPAGAQKPTAAPITEVRFLNDWRWEGPSAPLLLANQGYFQKENLNVKLSPGTGSAATVAKVASGEFDMGFGDFSALVEHAAKNPATPPPVAVYVLYERMPAALFVRKASGVRKASELVGKTIGAPAFDGGRRLWPAFAAYTKAGEAKWQTLDAAKREEAFVKGRVDGITGFYFTTLLNLEREGMSGSDYDIYPFYEAGLRLYGNVLLVNPSFLNAQPKAVMAVVRAYHAALKATLSDTATAVKRIKEMDPTIDERLELRRARLAFDVFVLTPTAKTSGLGTIDMARVEDNISLVVETFKLGTRPRAATLARTDFLPPASERVLP